jgi:hypothetical protein
VDPTGNEANALAATEDCLEGFEVGETLEVDVFVRGIPSPHSAPEAGGIGGFAFDFRFDPAVLQVDLVQAFDGPTILTASGPYAPLTQIEYNGAFQGGDPPGVTGDVRVAVFDFSTNYESGSGILTRVNLRSVGEGASALWLTDEVSPGGPKVLAKYGYAYKTELRNATIIVGGESCADPTPTLPPSPTPKPTERGSPMTPSPTPTPTPTIGPSGTAAQPSPIPLSVTPAALPRGGGPGAGQNTAMWLLALASGAGTIGASSAFLLARRRR